MARKYWRGREIDLGLNEPDGDPLGPDDRDRDLMDENYHGGTGRVRGEGHPRIVRAVVATLSIVALASLLIPMLAVIGR